jgi:hypothetical protein
VGTLAEKVNAEFGVIIFPILLAGKFQNVDSIKRLEPLDEDRC